MLRFRRKLAALGTALAATLLVAGVASASPVVNQTPEEHAKALMSTLDKNGEYQDCLVSTLQQNYLIGGCGAKYGAFILLGVDAEGNEQVTNPIFYGGGAATMLKFDAPVEIAMIYNVTEDLKKGSLVTDELGVVKKSDVLSPRTEPGDKVRAKLDPSASTQFCLTLIDRKVTLWGGCGARHGAFIMYGEDVDGSAQVTSPIWYEGLALTYLSFENELNHSMLYNVTPEGERSSESPSRPIES